MNLQEVKEKIGVSQLNLNTAETKAGEKTDWMRHWDNDERIAVSIHKETVAKIVADKEGKLNLGTQFEERVAEESGQKYSSFRVIIYEPTEVTL